MNALLFRTRVAVLWLVVAVTVSASLLLYLFAPGAVEDLAAGEMEGETLTDATGVFMAVVGGIPIALAAVTVLVGDRANRYVNLIGGLAYGLFGVFAVVSHLVAGDFNTHVVLVALAGAVAFLIGGLSFAGLRQQPSPAAAPQAAGDRPRERATV